jgi:hypothetical protein
MSPLREAIGLPILFLTIALSGGFRVTGRVLLVPPSVTALILAVLLLGVLIRSGCIRTSALLSAGRTPAENMSGAIVLITLFAATAQAINLLIPDTGLLHAVFAIFVFCQLLTIGAARTDRIGSLRSVVVLFGSLFALRYILLEALYATSGSTLNLVLRTLVSGATLGGVSYEPNAPVTGYVAFFTLALYIVGLLLLPQEPSLSMVRRHPDLPAGLTRSTLVVFLIGGLLASGACRKGPAAKRQNTQAPAAPALVTPEQRSAALRSARVWAPPPIPIGQAKLGVNPSGPGSLDEDAVVTCRLVIKAMGGTTPKFDCERPGNDVVRVKYGRGNPELHAEIAATRLLAALGFGADRMYVVKQVRCAGCPSFPFQALNCLAQTGIESACFAGGVDYSSATGFDYVSIERRMAGTRIESRSDEGWAFYEIDRIDEAAGGSPRAHVDALKLLAVFLAHWDNKAENQRLVCLPGGDQPGGGCSRPFALLQDLGAAFGPVKLDLHNWRGRPLWSDAPHCAVTMKDLPWNGATFPDQRISEAGRRFLLSLLEQLSGEQIEDLFAGARVGLSEGIMAEGRQPAAWAAAFRDKVRQLREGGPCG